MEDVAQLIITLIRYLNEKVSPLCYIINKIMFSLIIKQSTKFITKNYQILNSRAKIDNRNLPPSTVKPPALRLEFPNLHQISLTIRFVRGWCGGAARTQANVNTASPTYTCTYPILRAVSVQYIHKMCSPPRSRNPCRRAGRACSSNNH